MICDPPWENREKGERRGTCVMTQHAKRVTCLSDMHICIKQNNECNGRHCLHAEAFVQSSQLFNTLNVPKDTRVKRHACNICSKQEIFQV